MLYLPRINYIYCCDTILDQEYKDIQEITNQSLALDTLQTQPKAVEDIEETVMSSGKSTPNSKHQRGTMDAEKNRK